jgi:hypothetical protein
MDIVHAAIAAGFSRGASCLGIFQNVFVSTRPRLRAEIQVSYPKKKPVFPSVLLLPLNANGFIQEDSKRQRNIHMSVLLNAN